MHKEGRDDRDNLIYDDLEEDDDKPRLQIPLCLDAQIPHIARHLHHLLHLAVEGLRLVTIGHLLMGLEPCDPGVDEAEEDHKSQRNLKIKNKSRLLAKRGNLFSFVP